jgi:hypothetical protein
VRYLPGSVLFDDTVGLAHHPVDLVALLVLGVVVLLEDDEPCVTFGPHPDVAGLHQADELWANEIKVLSDFFTGVLAGSEQVIETHIR